MPVVKEESGCVKTLGVVTIVLSILMFMSKNILAVIVILAVGAALMGIINFLSSKDK